MKIGTHVIHLSLVVCLQRTHLHVCGSTHVLFLSLFLCGISFSCVLLVFRVLYVALLIFFRQTYFWNTYMWLIEKYFLLNYTRNLLYKNTCVVSFTKTYS